MGRFRKIETRTWGDEKFMELSPIPACGQGLWIYLLTGPHTNSIPGLFVSGKAALAEALNWDDDAFGKAFQELLDKKMVQFDRKTRLIWIPNALKYNLPESPNVIRSWKGQIRELPESDLLKTAISSIKGEIYSMGEGFQKAFAEAFGKDLSKPLPQPSPNQEQEQEQEQEEEFAGAEKSAPEIFEDHNPQEYQTAPDDFVPTVDDFDPIPSPIPSEPPKPTYQIPGDLKLSPKDLDELHTRFGPRSQEAIDAIARQFAAKDYGYKNHWAGAKTWFAKETSPIAWLDKATGKGPRPWEKPSAPPPDTRTSGLATAAEKKRQAEELAGIDVEGLMGGIRRRATG
jgi:hypothetical protein